ncbi:hypothetical protein QBC38DRAFT_34153 [Podospora fimiseda]|uniref:Uncharacterized protein n=1 Tax=Podospora fimiseda TaxID=252190 RepID=A0AAN7BIQ8_9PEZI|nr:hypothetical protein QBC38DRAFT_34153 [Podospora fimiseda]
MDQDQFGGRTDDDLFSDDIEPVPYEEQMLVVPELLAATADPAAAPEQPAPEPPTQVSTAPTPSQLPPKSLAQSRHYRPVNTNVPSPTTTTTAPESSINGPPPTAPKGPSAGNTYSTNTASAVSKARLGSGANPRTKLTDAELTARMEEMRLVNAAMTRRFEQAQRDEAEHAVAYAKGMEDARKRRAEEAAKRRVADEERKKLEDERAKNRDRKLKAMGMKEGGWDEGKEERLRDEERAFKGAHGGVRGVKGYGGKGTGGLSGSRFAPTGDDDSYNPGLRGRSGQSWRGARRGGRGGSRQLADTGDEPVESPPTAQLSSEEFPALPAPPCPAATVTASSTAAPKIASTWASAAAPVGDWAEESENN